MIWYSIVCVSSDISIIYIYIPILIDLFSLGVFMYRLCVLDEGYVTDTEFDIIVLTGIGVFVC